MSEEARNEEEALKAALRTTPECLTVEELASLADETAGDAVKEKRAGHVARCPRCSAELSLLAEFESTSAGPAETEEVGRIVEQLRTEPRWAEAGRVTRPAAQARPAFGFAPLERWKRLWTAHPVSAASWVAAAVCLVIASGLLLRQSRPPGLPTDLPGGGTVLRSGRVETIGPCQTIPETPSELKWKSFPNAVTYAVEVLEVDRTVLWNGETSRTTISLPDSVQQAAVPGKTLLWRVSALDAQGNRLGRSELERFQVAIPGAEPRRE